MSNPILVNTKISAEDYLTVKAKRANTALSNSKKVFIELFLYCENKAAFVGELIEVKAIIFEKFMNKIDVTYVNENGKLTSKSVKLDTDFYIKKM